MQKGVVRKRRTSPLSEYGKQLREKQELKAQYGLRERQLQRYVQGALKGGAVSSAEGELLRELEERLDSIVFRMGLADTRRQARQLISHGHLLVNDKKVRVPSFRVTKGDKIQVRPQSQEFSFFKNRKLALKKYEAPAWLNLDKERMSANVMGTPGPNFGEVGVMLHIPLVFEFYSR